MRDTHGTPSHRFRDAGVAGCRGAGGGVEVDLRQHGHVPENACICATIERGQSAAAETRRSQDPFTRHVL